MKKLIYIFIPILTILLMSHNTLAIEPDATSVFIYGSPGTIQTNCNGTYQATMCSPNSTSVQNIQFRPLIAMPLDEGSYWVEMYITFSSNGTSDAPLIVASATSITSGTIATFESVSSTTRGSTTVRIYRVVYKYSGTNTFYGPYTLTAASAWVNTAGYYVNSVTLYKETSNSDATNQQIVNAINSLNSTVQSNTPPSADEIADAVNAPEEQAADDISNQSTDDIETGDDSSATNLIGNINTLFTQIGNIQASNTCSISADFGNLDLGNINFCTGKDKLPFVVTFGAYAFELVFVVGTAIILVKQVLGLFDWARS